MALSTHKLHKPMLLLIVLQVGALMLIAPPLFSHYTGDDASDQQSKHEQDSSIDHNKAKSAPNHNQHTPPATTVTAPEYIKQQLRQQPDKPVHGIDVSHYQGNIDWPDVASANIRFAYLKATQGDTYQDPSFTHNMALIQKTNLQVGPYHFFAAADDIKPQLSNFLKTIKGHPVNLAPMVDVEVTQNQKPEEIKQRLLSFIQQLEKQTGCKPIIYSYASFWQTNITAEFDSYPFWLADYAKKPHPPTGVKNWDIWQYSDQGKVAGIQTAVDLDVLLDGEAKLKQLACHYTPSSSTASTTKPDTNTTASPAASIRVTPDTASKAPTS